MGGTAHCAVGHDRRRKNVAVEQDTRKSRDVQDALGDENGEAVDDNRIRFGLVGTHLWARAVHGAGLRAEPGVELVGVWGRDRTKTRTAADELGVRPYDDYARLLADVDAVSFAVPPDVQVTLATQAAQRGRHLLLDKPVATSLTTAQALHDAARDAGVRTTVFVTARFTPERRRWISERATTGPWYGASALWLGSAFGANSPFDTPWRHDKGALWDLGPHLITAMEDALGPVEQVLAACRGKQGLVHLVLRHTGGATSTVTGTLEAPPSAARIELTAWGEQGSSSIPIGTQTDVHMTLATAGRELARAVTQGDRVCVDLAYGVHLTEVLSEAEQLIGHS